MRLIAPLLVLLAMATGTTRAQLISPGALARVHAEVEGIRNCTQCHTLGQRGIDTAKCLSCHTPIRDRLRRNEGLHSRISRSCANCHADHRGEAADIAAFEERRFRHDLTGFRLVGRHLRADCRSCHTPAQITDADVRRRKQAAGRLAETYLGLPDDCASCHRREDPHTAAISSDCGTCHSAADWTRVSDFDHADTGFRLAGAHASATCTSCHGAEGRGAARFAIAETCTGCHSDDSPHGRQFGTQQCSNCHGPSGWRSAPNFDHARTDFALAGAHVRIACASCHGSGARAQWTGTAAVCASCHSDDTPHGDQFTGQSCGACHGPTAWASAPLFRHDRTDFPLTGAHLSANCASCHTGNGPGRQFADLPAACANCHDDAHDGALGTDCQACHATADWDRLADSFDAARFDHDATGFTLVGAHASADCASCHTAGAADGIVVTVLDDDDATFPSIAHETCLSCHLDAHDDAFADAPGGADCAGCHSQDAFAPAAFDAERHAETTFALTGAHLAVPCAACHTSADDGPPDFDLAPACQACHADRNPHGDTFADDAGITACGDCHATTDWDLAAFDHAATGFALDGAHAVADCASCHTRETLPDGRVRQAFRGLDPACATCHETPHADQFTGRTCASCHDTAAFTIAAFDHGQTAFPLTGAHHAVPCASCHVAERAPDGTAVVRFRPLPTDCASCHGS